MNKRLGTLVLALSFGLIISGRSLYAQAKLFTNVDESKVEAILKRLTLEEKVGQMTQVTLDVLTIGPDPFSSKEPLVLDPIQLETAFKKYKVGSVLNTANNRARTVEVWNDLISKLQEEAIKETGIPIIYGVDAIHGTTYTAGATFFPQQIGIAATWQPEFAYKGSQVTAYPLEFQPLTRSRTHSELAEDVGNLW
jgi:beta-glucosidase